MAGAVAGAGVGASHLHDWQPSPECAVEELQCPSQDSAALAGVSGTAFSIQEMELIQLEVSGLFPGTMLPPLGFALSSAVACQAMLFTHVWLDAHRSNLELQLTCKEG